MVLTSNLHDKKTKRFPVAFYSILEQTLNDSLSVYFTEYSPPPKCMNFQLEKYALCIKSFKKY